MSWGIVILLLGAAVFSFAIIRAISIEMRIERFIDQLHEKTGSVSISLYKVQAFVYRGHRVILDKGCYKIYKKKNFFKSFFSYRSKVLQAEFKNISQVEEYIEEWYSDRFSSKTGPKTKRIL